MTRGFSAIGLVSPRKPENVGGVLRAAHCYGVSQVNISGALPRSLSHPSNTPMAHRHTPTFIVTDVLEHIPQMTTIVAVDLVDGAISLTDFCHPERAIYVFGPENGTLGEDTISRADVSVFIPTRSCMNLASSVNVLLYDRLQKSGRAYDPYSMQETQILEASQ